MVGRSTHAEFKGWLLFEINVAQYIKFLATDLTAFTLSSKNLLSLLQKLYCATFRRQYLFIVAFFI